MPVAHAHDCIKLMGDAYHDLTVTQPPTAARLEDGHCTLGLIPMTLPKTVEPKGQFGNKEKRIFFLNYCELSGIFKSDLDLRLFYKCCENPVSDGNGQDQVKRGTLRGTWHKKA